MPSDERVPDFSRRADPALLPEWMDEPCSYEQFRDCLDDLAQVNAVSLGYRPTLRWMDQLLGAVWGTADSWHIVDVGCGRGDMLYHVAGWARRRGVRVRLTGVDLNPYAARAAAERYETWPAGAPVTWVTGDAFSYEPAGGVDVVISSLFTHHLGDQEIVRFLAWMEGQARRGWFINDLHRSAGACRVYGWLARVAGWHPFVQHDGPVSFRRSFSVEDWRGYGAAAGLDMARVRIKDAWPGRLCVGRIR
jgi:SAM-dependent methyltransferase